MMENRLFEGGGHIDSRKTRLDGAPYSQAPEQKVDGLLLQAETFFAIREALSGISELQGSSQRFSRQELLKLVDAFEALVQQPRNEQVIQTMLRGATSACGFRAALERVYGREYALAQQRSTSFVDAVLPKTRDAMPAVSRESLLNGPLPREEKLRLVETFAELDRVLGDQGISGSRWYSPFDVRQMIESVKTAMKKNNWIGFSIALNAVTQGEGLRAAVERIAKRNGWKL